MRLILLVCCLTGLLGGCSAQAGGGVSSFKECIAAGYPTLKTKPPGCITPEGKIFQEKEEPEETAGSGGCVNKCGDGKCQQVVCMAQGCPCAETPQTCPKDCVASF